MEGIMELARCSPLITFMTLPHKAAEQPAERDSGCRLCGAVFAKRLTTWGPPAKGDR
jgi:hypothetical protein